jgi:2-dehydropantoate 2-reductase
VQDYVIVTLKAHSVPPVVAKMQPLIGPETTVVSGVNGVPWWYFHKIGGPLEGTRLESVDPGNAQWDGFGPDRVLGCVVYPAAEVSSRGLSGISRATASRWGSRTGRNRSARWRCRRRCRRRG